MQKNIFIITGGPGFGKSIIINRLKALGFLAGEETARNIITRQKSINGDILPWKNPRKFQQEVLKQRIGFYESIPDNTVAFSDRGIPDQIAFARFNGFGTPKNLVEAAGKYRYAQKVFITPPWKEIYTQDEIRTETFQQACDLHEVIAGTYSESGYTLIEIPKTAIENRVTYILEQANIDKRLKF